MSSTTPRKPATSGSTRNTPGASANTTGTPSRSPSRMTTQTATPAAAASSVNRTRSIRNGAPLSARAAAVRKPAAPESAAEQDAKAEMQVKVDELQERLQQVELAYEESQKSAVVLQAKLDDALKEQGMLDERVHEHVEQINDLENEKKESLRARRELEQIYESEKAALTREQEDWASEKESMQSSIQRLRETIAQREIRAGLDDERRPPLSRQSSVGRSNAASPNPEERQFAPSSLHRSDSSDSRQTSKVLIQKDKIIESLRLELAEAQIKLVEMENMGGGRMQELQKQIYDVKMQNARLMEDNESFQLLLQEKALNGELLQPPLHSESRPPSSRNLDAGQGGGTSLADELESHADSEGGEETRRLQAEVNSMKDQNKALTLYINNIISRLLQHEQFEQILDKTPDLMAGPNAASRKYAEADKDKDLPPPPPDKDEQPAGFLQRARSVMGGKPKRPTSQILQPHAVEQSLQQQAKLDEPPTLHEDPQTAPSVPFTKSNRGHRRANSDWPAASVVTNMYRGPSPSISPLSPGLSSPTSRSSFFASPPIGSRVPSGSNVPTIPEKENAGPQIPQRDSKLSEDRHRNSVISNDGGIDEHSRTRSAERSNPSSPPRSTSSNGGERDGSTTAGSMNAANKPPGGAVMVGSRMRPLRLVQEAAEQDEAAKKQANRGSWFGWMNKGITMPAGVANMGLPGRTMSTDGTGLSPPSQQQ